MNHLSSRSHEKAPTVPSDKYILDYVVQYATMMQPLGDEHISGNSNRNTQHTHIGVSWVIAYKNKYKWVYPMAYHGHYHSIILSTKFTLPRETFLVDRQLNIF